MEIRGLKMNKETQGKIASIIASTHHMFDERYGPATADEFYDEAGQIIGELEKPGYRKLPNKPPLLSEGDFPKKGEPDFVFPQCCIPLERIAFAEGAKAQLRVCVKHYEGVNWQAKDKPPLLSDEEIVDAWLTGAGVSRDERSGIDFRDAPQRHRQIAQAQREADVKWYGGK